MNLSELSQQLMEQKNRQVTSEDGRITMEYVNYLDEVSQDIIKDIPDENFVTAVSIIQGNIMTKLLTEGEISLKDVKFLMSDDFSEAVAIAFKLSLAEPMAAVSGLLLHRASISWAVLFWQLFRL